MAKKVRCFVCGKKMGRGEYTISVPASSFSRAVLGEKIYRHRRKCVMRAVPRSAVAQSNRRIKGHG